MIQITEEQKGKLQRRVKGALKKSGYWIIIAVAFLMSAVFVHLGKDILGINLDFLMMIGWFTLTS